MNYEIDYQDLRDGNKQPGDFAIKYLYEMAEQPFAVVDGYAAKKEIYFGFIRQHPRVTIFDRLRVDTYEADQWRRAKRYTEARDSLLAQRVPKNTPVEIMATFLQALGQVYYHSNELDLALHTQMGLIKLRRFGKLSVGKQLLAYESLFTTLLRLGKTEEAVRILQRNFSYLVTASLQNHEVQRGFGGFIHVWADMEITRQRYMMAANLFYILHITPELDPRNNIVAAMKFLHSLDLAGVADDARTEAVKQYFLANYSRLEEGDKVGHADAWQFARRQFGISE